MQTETETEPEEDQNDGRYGYMRFVVDPHAPTYGAYMPEQCTITTKTGQTRVLYVYYECPIYVLSNGDDIDYVLSAEEEPEGSDDLDDLPPKYGLVRFPETSKRHFGMKQTSRTTTAFELIRYLTKQELMNACNGYYDGRGGQYHYQRGLLHSVDDRPSFEDERDCYFEWHCNGLLHRDHDRPAIDSLNHRVWYQHGQKHRSGRKPAEIRCGVATYFLHGVEQKQTKKQREQQPKTTNRFACFSYDDE